MKVFATYCSALKNELNGSVPAVELYASDRILDIYTSAKKENVPCFILSGKYGLIPAETPIPYYDHLLVPGELEEHTKLVAKQLRESHISKLSFFMRSLSTDKNLETYRDCIVWACKNANVSVEVIFLKDS